MSFRKERKFRVSISDSVLIFAELQKRGIQHLYKKRLIQSQYFDTKNFQMHFDSEEGLLPRNKVRVRWYGNNFENINLERKVSSVEGRYKTSKNISYKRFKFLKKNGLNDRDYGLLIPSALISYERAYFKYMNIRITFDSNISYQLNSKKILAKDGFRVIEIKAAKDITDDFLEKIIPIPSSRFSKYSRAFLHTLKNENV